MFWIVEKKHVQDITERELKFFYYPLEALLARENTITMHNGHK